jgi:hypothetical protein
MSEAGSEEDIVKHDEDVSSEENFEQNKEEVHGHGVRGRNSNIVERS